MSSDAVSSTSDGEDRSASCALSESVKRPKRVLEFAGAASEDKSDRTNSSAGNNVSVDWNQMNAQALEAKVEIMIQGISNLSTGQTVSLPIKSYRESHKVDKSYLRMRQKEAKKKMFGGGLCEL